MDQPSAALPSPEDSLTLYQRFLAQAEAIAADEVVDFPGEASLVYHNARIATEVVLAEEARIRAELPRVDIALLRETPLVAQALIFAASQVNRDVRSPGVIGPLVSRAYELRALLIDEARPLVRSGKLPRDEFERILRGTGRIDAANDCVDLAALFRSHWPAIQAKVVATEAELDEAARVGSQLQTMILPGRAVRRRQLPPEVLRAVDVRNRFWTLLRRRYDLVWRAAAWLFGEEGVDEKVPALLSGRRRGPADDDTGAGGGAGG